MERGQLDAQNLRFDKRICNFRSFILFNTRNRKQLSQSSCGGGASSLGALWIEGAFSGPVF